MRAIAGVAGGGLMGSGIAAKLAASGMHLIVYDTASGAAESVREACSVNFAELVAAGVMSEAQADAAVSRVQVVSDVGKLVKAPFIVEAIFESLPAKHALYLELEQVVPQGTIIASSTSGFTPEILFEHALHPERFLVAHFWNPPHIIPLVEVVGTQRTGEAAIARTMETLKQCGCEPVRLYKAVPGFIGNRIQFAVFREALHLLQQGVADAATIDAVVKQTLGRRYPWMGPLEVADAGGLETYLNIANHLMPELAKDEESLDVLRAHAKRGETGLRSGKGLYVWDQQRREQYALARQKMMMREGAGTG